LSEPHPAKWVRPLWATQRRRIAAGGVFSLWNVRQLLDCSTFVRSLKPPRPRSTGVGGQREWTSCGCTGCRGASCRERGRVSGGIHAPVSSDEARGARLRGL
jgi:hypothetical protein